MPISELEGSTLPSWVRVVLRETLCAGMGAQRPA